MGWFHEKMLHWNFSIYIHIGRAKKWEINGQADILYAKLQNTKKGHSMREIVGILVQPLASYFLQLLCIVHSYVYIIYL